MDDLKALYDFRKNKMLYAMFVPIAIYFIVFAYVPMTGIILAFKEYNYQGGTWGSPWNGWSNFEYFFKSGKAWIVTKNTIAYNVVFLALYTFFSVAIAIFIAEMRAKWF